MKRWFASTLFFTTLSLSLAACGSHLNLPGDETLSEPVVNDNGRAEIPDAGSFVPAPVNDGDRAAILAKYDYLDPKKIVPSKALQNAVIFFDQNKSRIKNRNYITVIDYKQHSGKKRMYLININTGEVWNTYTSHGKGSDTNRDGIAERFSNVSGSNASSLGYFLTGETYYGQHGLSLRMDGLSSSNSNARSRAIVIHGAKYVTNSPVMQGRSWGCPAVAMEFRDRVVQLLKGGSLILSVN